VARVQAEVLETRGRQARRVALGAHDDHLDVAVDGLRDARVARGIEAPFEVVALDQQRAGDLTLRPALPLGPGVDEQRAALDSRGGFGRCDPLQARTCRREQVVDVLRHRSSPGPEREPSAGSVCVRVSVSVLSGS
jgi:hypothetical protein